LSFDPQEFFIHDLTRQFPVVDFLSWNFPRFDLKQPPRHQAFRFTPFAPIFLFIRSLEYGVV
jgi:hypothetical protein